MKFDAQGLVYWEVDDPPDHEFHPELVNDGGNNKTEICVFSITVSVLHGCKINAHCNGPGILDY